ncbi:MAG TPA: PIN domain-containing protein, partial [Acidobacteriaceae bacterium]|nr:PIN domain-containing protein [Acidobacteriaceae bacterium]
MMTWIDTNVMVALWEADHALQALAVRELIEASRTGAIAISGCVYAEFVAGPKRPPGVVWAFLHEAEIDVAWDVGEDVWRLAAERFSQYPERRRMDRGEPKRFLADFLIGAQATVRGGRLLTFDRRIYAA